MKKSAMERLFVGIPMAISFIVLGLIVLAITGIISLSTPIVDILIILGIIAFGMISCLLPARILTKNKKCVYAWVVVGLTALVCLLWIIFIFVGQSVIDALVLGSFEGVSLKDIWTYTQITIFLTIQTFIFSLVVSNIYVFKKTMIPFQVIMYLSNIIVDVWFSILIFATSITNDSFSFGAQFLWQSKLILTIFILAFAFSTLSSAILKSIQRRRQRLMTMEDHDVYERRVKGDQHKTESIEERIKKLDDLKEKGLITQEEYSAKKAKLLEDL